MRDIKPGRPQPARADRTNWHDLERRSFFMPPGTIGTGQIDLTVVALHAGKYGTHRYGLSAYGV